jgi:hypothetical protein
MEREPNYSITSSASASSVDLAELRPMVGRDPRERPASPKR